MKSGCLYIDGVDVYTEYGVYVIEGGWMELVNLPPLKTVTSNDWQEEDGVEVDTESFVLNTREVTLKFAVSGAYSRIAQFIEYLSDRTVHTFLCAEIGRTFRLRLVSTASLEYLPLLGFLSMKFADDYPLDGYTYAEPTGGGLAAIDAYRIDGVRFSDYGVRLLKGSLAEVLKTPNVKTALLRNIPSQAGAIYDTEGVVTYKTKDVKLTCLLRADSLSEMWRNYYALLYNLVRPMQHVLYVDALGQSFDCYYKSCSVSDFVPTGRVWLQFTLTLTFTGDSRIIVTEPALRFVNSAASLRFTSSGAVRFI